DPYASEARDILLSNSHIAYRLQQSIRIWFQGKVLEFPANAERLRYFQSQGEEFLVMWDTVEKQTRWRRLNTGGTTLAEGLMPGSPRAALQRGDQNIIALQTPTGLSLYFWKSDQPQKWLDIENGLLGSYVSLREIGGNLRIA